MLHPAHDLTAIRSTAGGTTLSAVPAANPRDPDPAIPWLRIGRQRWQRSLPAPAGDAWLMVSANGPLEGRIGSDGVRLEGPLAALYLPDDRAVNASLQEFEGLLLRLQRSRLERAAALLSDQGISPRRFAPLLQETTTVDAVEGVALRQLRRLLVVARLLEPNTGHLPEEIQQLGLDDVLDRLVVLAMWGEPILRGSPPMAPAGGGREAILDELVAWIRANSHRPLHLVELERHSGYSERSLRNAFQERFGCPPKQWIRRTRMESARRRLLDATPGESVSSIARDHGYQHVSQFSRDFRSVFGQRPSLLMRQARRALS